MPNISCSPSCEKSCRTRTVRVLGRELAVKSYICSSDGVHYPEKPEPLKLQLSVCPTSYCPAACPFCIAGDTKKELRRLDLKRFEQVMRLLRQEDRVRGVKITGGEPFYDVPLLDEVIAVLFDVFGFSLEVSVSTNGMWLEQLRKLRYLDRIDAIHISRHHYDDAVNRKLFGGAAVPSGEALREIIGTVPYRDIFVFNCMLLRDYIGSPEEAHRFLDFAVSTGASKVGFITCSPVNGYAGEQAVPYEKVLCEGDPSILFTRGFTDHEFCRCRDGVYASPSGGLIEFYGRSTDTDGCRYCRGLVYDADDRVRDGFGGNIIL